MLGKVSRTRFLEDGWRWVPESDHRGIHEAFVDEFKGPHSHQIQCGQSNRWRVLAGDQDSRRWGINISGDYLAIARGNFLQDQIQPGTVVAPNHSDNLILSR